jgi:hypothetical protein
MESKVILERDKVFTVKIYFISPISLISVVLDALIRMEFEAYNIDKKDKDNLLKILPHNIRNVMYICINNELEMNEWLEYVEKSQTIENTLIQIGAFVHSNISQQSCDKLLSLNTAVIKYSELVDNTLDVIKKVLTYFEAKGKRNYIRAKALSGTDAYFSVKTMDEPIKATITDISIEAFSCTISSSLKPHFQVGEIFFKILLVLKGIRVRVSAKVMGFSRENPELYIFKFLLPRMSNGKISFIEMLPKEEHEKIHNYIRIVLKENIETELAKIKD